MRRTRTVTCPSCGAGWDAERARFCGSCGLPLRRPDLPTVDSASDGRWPRRLGWIGGGVAAVAALTAVAVMVDGLQLPRARPDPGVELADDDGGIVPEGEPPSAAERAALLAPFDPNRLRCEPRGCEVWRLDLTSGVFPHSGNGHVEVAPFGDLIVISSRDHIVAVDAVTGAVRWEQTWPADEDRQRGSGWTVMLATDDEAVLVLARPERGYLLALDREGTRLWNTPTGDRFHNVAVIGSTLLAAHGATGDLFDETGQRITDPGETLTAFAATTGQQLWERTGATLMTWSERVAVVRDGDDVAVVDLDSGGDLARRPLEPDAWLYPYGGVLLLFGQESQALLGPDLQPLPGLERLVEIQPLEDDEHHVIAIRRADGADGTAGASHVTLVDGDGVVVWDVEMNDSPSSIVLCCPNPRLLDDAVVLPPPTGTSEPVWLDRDDGSRVDPGDFAPAPAEGDVWWLSSSTAIEQRHDGFGLFHDGNAVDVHGQSGWPITREPPFVIMDGRSLLAVQPMPAD